MASGYEAGLTIALLFSLIFSSVGIAYFVQEMGLNENIPQIILPNEVGGFNQYQNFESGAYNSTLYRTTNGGTWKSINGIGIILDTVTSGSMLIVNGLDSNKGIITNEYVINNSVEGDYQVILYYSGGLDQNILDVTDSGFYITNGRPYILGYRDYIPYVWARKFSPVTITTTYDKSTHTATWALNHNPTTTFSSNKLAVEDINYFGIFPRAYGGVGSYTVGFALKSYNSAQQFADTANLLTDSWLFKVGEFLKTVLLIVAWTLPESVLPLTLNILLIKTQTVGLLVCIIIIMRG